MNETHAAYAKIFRLAKRLPATVDYVDTIGEHLGMTVHRAYQGGAYTVSPDGRVHCPLFADLSWVRLCYPTE